MAVAVTTTEYVPGGVFMFMELGGAAPPPPPAPAQLNMPNELMKMAIKSRLRSLRLNASGRMAKLRTMTNMRDEGAWVARSGFFADVEEMPVVICTVALPVAFAETASMDGLKVQAELDGSEPQAKLKVPLDPLIVARLNVKLAVWPLETVWLD